MILKSFKFLVIWVSLFSSFSVFAQDSLLQVSDSSLVVPEDFSYLYEVDSLWIQHTDSLAGLKVTKIDSSVLVMNETSLTYKLRLDSINELTPLNISHNPHLDRYINEYLRYKHQLSKLMGLSKLYFPQMEAILDKHDIPLEIKNLSVIESALNPNARSYRGATGLWQFMLPTAKECGLVVNSYVDERKDPTKSTEAACIYLKRLYDIYGVWELSIAAYNCGPGNVNKAIRKAGGSKNFWKIRSFLPRETQKYVPRFMAMCYLMEFGESHGVYPTELDLTFWQTDTVVVKKALRFDQITEKTSIATQTLTTLNPQYKLKVIPTSNEGNLLVIPVKNMPEFLDAEASFRKHKPEEKHPYVKPAVATYEEERSRKKSTYIVRSGDVLGSIAQNNGVSVSQIKRWNGIRGTRIKAGQRLTLYAPENIKKSTLKKTNVLSSNSESTYNYTVHTVRKGDTLWDIAKLYSGVTSEDIKRLNQGINPNNLKMGSVLRIKKI